MSEQSNTLLVKRLREAMSSRGITPKELAQRAKVGKSFVYDILSGKSLNPTTTRLSALSSVLNVPISYFVASGEGKGSDYNYLSYDNYLPIRHINPNSDEPFIFLRSDFFDNLVEDKEFIIAFTVQGDAMEDTLYNGDVVLINQNKCLPHPSGLFLIKEGIGLAIKRLEYINNLLDKVSVMSDNKKYKDYEISMCDISIIGKVVWYSRKI